MALRIPTLGDRRRVKNLVTSFTGIATAGLVIGKLAGVVTLPWWAVVGPLWMPFVLMVAMLLLIAGLDCIYDVIEFTSHDREEDDDDDEWDPKQTTEMEE